MALFLAFSRDHTAYIYRNVLEVCHCFVHSFSHVKIFSLFFASIRTSDFPIMSIDTITFDFITNGTGDAYLCYYLIHEHSRSMPCKLMKNDCNLAKKLTHGKNTIFVIPKRLIKGEKTYIRGTHTAKHQFNIFSLLKKSPSSLYT